VPSFSLIPNPSRSATLFSIIPISPLDPIYWATSGVLKIVPVGQGTLDWRKIFSAAKTGGIRNYFVEMDLPLMKASVPYLRHLQVI
jgi:sugar phosphate isomerase/epimerase